MKIKFVEARHIRLFESHSMDQDFFSASDVASANEYRKSKSFDEWLSDLKEGGHTDAVVAFMLQAEPAIMKVFWDNFLGKNGKAANKRLQKGAYTEFLSMVFSNLIDPNDTPDVGAGKFKNPFLAFAADKVSGSPVSALIGWVQRYIRNWAIATNVHNRDVSGETDISYEQRYEELGDAAYNDDNYSGTSEVEQAYIDDEIADCFLEMAGDSRMDVGLKRNPDATPRNCLILMIEQPELLNQKRALADALGTSINVLALRNGKSILDKLEAIMKDYDIGASEMHTVLTSKDKDTILDILRAK